MKIALLILGGLLATIIDGATGFAIMSFAPATLDVVGNFFF